VPDADRILRGAVLQVGHLAGEELGVRAAHTGAVHVHHHLARPGLGRRDVADLRPTRAGDHNARMSAKFERGDGEA
jgi:hypothetical protein